MKKIYWSKDILKLKDGIVKTISCFIHSKTLKQGFRNAMSPRVLKKTDPGYESVRELDFAIGNKDCFNIALTGIYGSGKSSIIKTVLKKHRFKKVLKLSLSRYISKEENKNFNEQEVERTIFQHVLYKSNPNQTPLSKYIERGDGVFFTKMNKLLFYTDFLAYRLTGKGMTGLCYKAITHGPVPLHWDRVYSFYNDINQEIVQYSDGRAGTKLVSNLSPDMTYFSEDEKEMLEYVYQRFKKETPAKISETSHHEDAWKKYLNSDRLISFEMAFSLKAI